MIRAIVFGLIGAGAMYLYLNPGDMDGLISMFTSVVNDGATLVKEATEK
jgi:hypothetical protein